MRRWSAASRATAQPATGPAAQPATAFLIAIGVPIAAAAVGMCVLAIRMRRAERAASAPVTDIQDVFPEHTAGRPPADALVVFGARVTTHGPCAELRARLDHAVRLWQLGVAPVITVTGGVADSLDEADAMTRYLNERGVPSRAMTTARPGDDTRATLGSLGRLGDRQYLAVSSPYHAFRIRGEACRQRLRVTVSTPPSTPETHHRPTHRARFASELVAVLVYALPPTWAVRLRAGSGNLRHVAPLILSRRLGPSALLSVRRGAPS